MVSQILHGYTSIPLWMINAAAPFVHLIPLKYRYGNTFRMVREDLQKEEKMSLDEILFIQNTRLQKLIHHAYENVLYYTDIMNESGINPFSIKDAGDLNQFPLLTKDLINKNREKLIAKNFDISNLSYVTTSGTTGKPLGICIDKNNGMVDWAYGSYLYKRAGWKDNCSKLMLRGKGFYNKNHGIPWQYDCLKKELSVDIFQTDDEHLETYCKAIEKYKPDNVYGYISAIIILCKYIQKRNGIHHKFKGIYASSENISESDRIYAESVLGARLFSNYGMTERVILAGECEYSSEYHIEPLYGVTELIDENNNVIKDNRTGELVGTGFSNWGMPLIRYRTGDMANYSSISNCKCGRCHKRLEKIIGRRRQDFLYNKFGGKISLAAINMHTDVFDSVEKMQFVQNIVGEVTLKIMPDGALTDSIINNILSELDQKVKKGIIFKVQIVDDIPLAESGKYHLIIQNVKDIN